MDDMQQVTSNLDRIGQQLRDRPSIVSAVMSDLEPTTVELKRPRNVRLRILATLAAAACLFAAMGMWLSVPASLYAQTVAALNRVETVHVTGWTSSLRKLERMAN